MLLVARPRIRVATGHFRVRVGADAAESLADGDTSASTSAYGTFVEPPIGRSHGTTTLAWAWMWKPGGVALVAALMRVVTASAPCGLWAGAAVLG